MFFPLVQQGITFLLYPIFSNLNSLLPLNGSLRHNIFGSTATDKISKPSIPGSMKVGREAYGT